MTRWEHRLETWSDYHAGRLGKRACARLERAAIGSSTALAARDRAKTLRTAIEGARNEAGPELAWDSVGARIHWEVSLERRGSAERRQYRRWLAVGSLAAAAIGAAAVWASSDADTGATAQIETLPSAATPAEPAVEVVAEPVVGLLTLSSGDAARQGRSLDKDRFDERVVVGTQLSTKSGRVAVQFEAGSGFGLGRDSSLVLNSFDSSAIELDLRGRVDVMVSHRKPGQRFLVAAGSYQIEVRGTAFRVDHREERLVVACAHGQVDVTRDGVIVAVVKAGQKVEVANSKVSAATLATSELGTLSRELELPLLAEWRATDLELGRPHPSARLEVPAARARNVSIDGVVVGTGATFMRVAGGRHLVAVADARGRFAQSEWFSVAAGGDATADFAPPVAPLPPRRRASKRRGELARALAGNRALTQCVRPLIKQGLADGAYAVLELGINRDGSKAFVNTVDSNLPPRLARCVRDVVHRAPFARGGGDKFTYRIDF